MKDEPIRIGGLLRCCILSIHEHEYQGVEGSVLQCKYCTGGSMIFHDGAWEWNKNFS